MSQTRKRALACEGEGHENRSRSGTGSRPLRPAKRRKVEDCRGCNSSSSAENPKNAQIGGGGGRVKRQVWTDTSIEAFAEGLCQHGKSFHRILKFMQTKYRKKNDPVIPNLNKDQVRFYYYRTWHKVSALLTDPTQPSASDSKKSKMAKSPCTTDSSTSIGEKFESSGKLALTRQSSSGVGGGRGEGEDGNVHSGMGVNDKGEVGKITSKIGMPLDQKTVETDATGSEVQEVDCTATSQECLVADGNDHVIPPGQGVRLSPCRDVKLDLSNSGQSPPQCASLSPPDQSSAEVRLCEGGGSDEGIVTAVMSEEEEGPLDSSMEDLPSSPPLALTFPITTVDTDMADVVKSKENSCLSEKVVSRRDSVRGDTVVVNGVRHSLDLVALIAYFKLKKRCQADHNFPRRLSELVYLGFTTIPGRTKGKRKVQIKLHNCRALQPSDKPTPTVAVRTGGGEGGGGGQENRANECPQVFEKPVTEVEVGPSVPHIVTPSTLTLELRPLTSSTWRYVQSLSQNPRLRMTVASSLTLGQLLDFLCTKWQLKEEGRREGGRGDGEKGDRGKGEGGKEEGANGEGGMGEGGGGEQGAGNKESYHRLKLYHTHGDNQSLNNKQSTSPMHCASLHDVHVDAVASPTNACSLYCSTHQSGALQVSVSSVSADNGSTATADPVKCTCTCTCSGECEKKHVSSALCTCTNRCRLQQEKYGLPSHMMVNPTEGLVSQTDSENVSQSTCSAECSKRSPGPSSSQAGSVQDMLTGGAESQESVEGGNCTKEMHMVTSGVCLCNIQSAIGEARGLGRKLDDALRNTVHELDYSPQCVLSSIHHKLQSPERLQFLYDVLLKNDPGSVGRLRVALKIATALGRDTSLVSPSSPLPHTSPTVADYMRSLPRRSPWRSPLSKYRHLKQRSPHKRISPKKLNFSLHTKFSPRKTQMHTCSEDPLYPSLPTASVTVQHPSLPTSTHLHSLSSPAPSLLSRTLAISTRPYSSPSPTPSLTPTTTLPCASPSPSIPLPLPSPSASLTHLYRSILEHHKKKTTTTTSPSTATTTQPPVNLVTVPKASIGQFNSLNLHSLFSVATDSLEGGKGHKDTVSKSSDSGGRFHMGTGLGSKLSEIFGFRTRASGSTSSGPSVSTSRVSLPATSSSVQVTVVSSAAVSTHGSMCVTTASTHLPKAVNVRVVSSVEPRSFTLPPSVVHQPRQQEHSVHAALASSQLQAQTSSQHVNLPTSQPSFSLHSLLQASAVSSTTTSTTTVSQPAHTGISDSTMALINSMRRNKRHRMQQKTAQARQIVPRPLPFGLPTTTPLTLSMPMPSYTALHQGGGVSQQTAAVSPSHRSNVQQQLTALLQTLVVQQQQRKQQQQQKQQSMQENQRQEPPQHSQDLSSAITRKAEEILQMQSSLPQTTTPLPSDPTIPSSSPLAMAATCDLMSTAVTVPVSSVVECAPAIQTDIPDGDIQAAILDNLFVNYSAGGKSPKSTQLFHTSSDTVDQLLRGLNTRTQSDSIQKLSRETASVLPTFARVLESSVSFQSPSSPANASVGHDGGGSVSSEKGAGEEGEEEEEEGREGGSDIGEDEREPTPADDAMADGGDHSNLSLSEVLAGAGADDPTFQQLARCGNILEGLEFPGDSLLPATPPRHRAGATTVNLPSPTAENDISIGSLLDFLMSPEKDQNRTAAPSGLSLSHVDPTYRSLLEETSVDYIQKFKELASQMNTEH